MSDEVDARRTRDTRRSVCGCSRLLRKRDRETNEQERSKRHGVYQKRNEQTKCLLVFFLLFLGFGCQDIEHRIELFRRLAVRATHAVGPSKVLAVVDREEHVMESVVGWSIDNRLQGVVGDHVRVVNLIECFLKDTGR